MEEAIKRAKIGKEMVEEVILGHCIQRTDEPNTARTAVIKMGLPMSVPAFTVQRQCSSAMQAMVSGAQMIKLGEADVVIAGGVETMSSAPYMLKTARWGQRLQHGQMSDTVWDVLTDPLNGMLMERPRSCWPRSTRSPGRRWTKSPIGAIKMRAGP